MGIAAGVVEPSISTRALAGCISGGFSMKMLIRLLSVGLNVGVSAAENPTLSIVPIQGQQFIERVLTPLAVVVCRLG